MKSVSLSGVRGKRVGLQQQQHVSFLFEWCGVELKQMHKITFNSLRTVWN